MLPVLTSRAVSPLGFSVSVFVIRAVPATSSFAAGLVVPMPTLPPVATKRFAESG